MFILQTNIIVIGYDSDDSFKPGVNEITILNMAPVKSESFFVHVGGI